MTDTSDEYTLDRLQQDLIEFARERDWERFHTAKNLLLALVGEVGELAELFQWLNDEEAFSITNTEERTAVEDEIADVLIYLLRLAQVLDIDPLEAARLKMKKNAEKYPAPSPPEAGTPAMSSEAPPKHDARSSEEAVQLDVAEG